MPDDGQVPDDQFAGRAPAEAAGDAAVAAASTEADAQSPPPRQRRVARRLGRALFEWAKSVSLALALFLVLRAFLVEAFKIPSGSMEGTLLVGDFLLVNKLVYGAEVPFTGKRLPAVRAPRNGDVLVFQWPMDPTKNFVKRLVGVPGDTLSMDHGVLVRNGKRLVEEYTQHVEPNYDPAASDFGWQRGFLVPKARAARAYRPSRNNWGPIVVPARHSFVLGDNRDNSLDSRYWGFVPDSLVRGSPLIVYYSYAADSTSSFSWLTHVRWNRLLTLVR
ncbi:MAG: signal peptidase I [Gemmatimonadetes bacterium]|nr:signal peptidase I [Gemmatimonadota bacterium]